MILINSHIKQTILRDFRSKIIQHSFSVLFQAFIIKKNDTHCSKVVKYNLKKYSINNYIYEHFVPSALRIILVIEI